MKLKRDFTKYNLKNGMIVEIRKGTLLLVLNDCLINNECWASLNHYNEDLTRYEFLSDDFRDIMKVYITNKEQTFNNMFNNKKLIWERFDYKEMSLEELEKELGYKIKVINS